MGLSQSVYKVEKINKKMYKLQPKLHQNKQNVMYIVEDKE